MVPAPPLLCGTASAPLHDLLAWYVEVHAATAEHCGAIALSQASTQAFTTAHAAFAASTEALEQAETHAHLDTVAIAVANQHLHFTWFQYRELQEQLHADAGSSPALVSDPASPSVNKGKSLASSFGDDVKDYDDARFCSDGGDSDNVEDGDGDSDGAMEVL